jgi:hypothetical protein
VSGQASAKQKSGLWRLKVTLYNSSGEQIGQPWYSEVYRQRWIWVGTGHQ